MTYTLGIDLGTTYSAAAVHADGVTEMVSLGNRATIMPTAVFVTESGEILVGEAATRRGLSEPERLCREFKRRIGDSVPIIVGGSPFSAEALTARVLRSILATVTEQRGGSPDRIVLTHPANWGAFKMERLAQAIRMGELVDAVGGRSERVTTLTEPEAAAISYASTERVPVDDVIAVYDLGGGTFDAAVLRKTATGFELVGTPEGIERLGGVDVDEAIYTHVQRALGDVVENLDPDDPATAQAAARLRQDCIEAKEALSSDTQVSIPVLLPNLHTEVRLTRGELESMVRPVLEDTIGALRRAISSTGLVTSDIDRVLLVGGSSRIPLVGQLVTEALGRPFFVDAHPKHAVALGAAISVSTPTLTTSTHAALPPEPVAPTPAPAPAPPPPPDPPAARALDPVIVAMASAAPAAPPSTAPAPPSPTPMPPPAPAPGPPTVAMGPDLDTTGPLVHDPTDPTGPPPGSADLPPGYPSPTPPPTGRPRAKKKSSPGLRILAALAAVAALVVVVLVVKGSGGKGGDDDDGGQAGLTVAGTTKVAGFPDGLAVEDDNLWVASTGGHAVQRLDLGTGNVETTVPLDGEPLAVAVGAGSVWVTQRNADTVARLDPTTGEVKATITVPDQPGFLLFADDALWVSGAGGAVSKIDPATNQSVDILTGLSNAAAVAIPDPGGPIWVSVNGSNEVLVHDPAGGGQDAHIPVGAQPDFLVAAPSGLWVANRGDGTLSRINKDTRKVDATVQVGGSPTGLAADGDSIWVITQGAGGAGELLQVDGPKAEVLQRGDVGVKPLGVTTSPGRVWVTLSGANQVARIEP